MYQSWFTRFSSVWFCQWYLLLTWFNWKLMKLMKLIIHFQTSTVGVWELLSHSILHFTGIRLFIMLGLKKFNNLCFYVKSESHTGWLFTGSFYRWWAQNIFRRSSSSMFYWTKSHEKNTKHCFSFHFYIGFDSVPHFIKHEGHFNVFPGVLNHEC